MKKQLLKNGVLTAKDLSTRRHGGLYYNGSMLTHADIDDTAQALEMETPQLYQRLIYLARIERTEEQSKQTRKELFNKVEGQLTGFTGISEMDFVRAVIKSFDEAQILVETNTRGMFIMPSEDYDTILNANELGIVFDRFMSAAGYSPAPRTGKDVFNRFIQTIRLE